MEIRFQPIGVVHTKAGDDDVKEKGDQEGELKILPEFAEGLDGIEGYSHLFVLAYFDRLRPEQIGPLKVKPRALLRRGFSLDNLPELGVFALDSPTRPNPIGLTLVRVLRRDGKQDHRARVGFLRRDADPRHQNLSEPVSHGRVHGARVVSQAGRSDRSRLSPMLS